MGASTVQYSAHETSIRRLIREASANTWQPADLKAFLNVALREAGDELAKIVQQGFLRDISTPQDVTAGTEEYNLPTGFKTFSKVEFYSGGNWIELDKVSLDDWDPNATAQDPPTAFALLDSTVLLIPAPATAQSGVLRFIGCLDVTEFDAASSVSGLDQSWDNFLDFRAAAIASGVEGRKPLAAYLTAEANSARRFAVQVASRRHPSSLSLTTERVD